MFTVAALAAFAACDGPSGPAPPDKCRPDGGGCALDDPTILECTGAEAGIYGTVTTTCVGSGAPYPCGGCSTADITVHGEAGVVGQLTFFVGYYAIALPAGAYSVCCNLGNPNYPDDGADFSCTSITLAPNEMKRVDETFTESPGGDYCAMIQKTD